MVCTILPENAKIQRIAETATLDGPAFPRAEIEQLRRDISWPDGST
ncbi:MAG TPA: hypothetical protein VHD15_02805 [Hyphomicrobiales bacterium]|nr:hypothetical protein [Hyphomicrobiales bacterium]